MGLHLFDFCEQILFWRSNFSIQLEMLKSAFKLLKVTFDVSVPKCMTHFPSLLNRALVLRFGRFQGVAWTPGVLNAPGWLEWTLRWRTTEVQQLWMKSCSRTTFVSTLLRIPSIQGWNTQVITNPRGAAPVVRQWPGLGARRLWPVRIQEQTLCCVFAVECAYSPSLDSRGFVTPENPLMRNQRTD